MFVANAPQLFFFIQPIRPLFFSITVVVPGLQIASFSRAEATATATKTSLENKHLGNDDYFAIIVSSSHPLLLIEHAANGLVEEPLKLI